MQILPDIFEKYDLREAFPTPEGTVPAKLLPVHEDGTRAMLVGYRAGRRYTPSSHGHAHLLIIRAGTGRFRLGADVYDYAPGNKFDVSGNVTHGFVYIATDTVVEQQQKPPGR